MSLNIYLLSLAFVPISNVWFLIYNKLAHDFSPENWIIGKTYVWILNKMWVLGQVIKSKLRCVLSMTVLSEKFLGPTSIVWRYLRKNN